LWQVIFGSIRVDFLLGYIIVAWLSWLPNLFVAFWINNRKLQVSPLLKLKEENENG
jgi:hypothetical protein